jgi:hypothetical protein
LSGGPFSAPATFGGDTAEITFTTDEAGTYYYVALPSANAAPADAAEIRAASSSVSANVQAGAATTVTVSGLTPKTAYIVYLIVVDARGNTSDILTIGPFTPAYTPGGQLAADLGKENIKGDDKAVTLIKDTTITSGTVTVPAEVTLDTGMYKLTLNNNATLSVNGALSVRKEFNMAGILSVGTNGEINVESGGTIVFAEVRTGGGKLEGTINIMDGGISKDLGSNANGGLWTVETGKTVFHTGAQGYSDGDDPENLLIGKATDDPETTYITLTSGTFTSSTGTVGGYILDGDATLNRTFGIADGQMLTIKENRKLTVHIQAHDMDEADGLWVLDPTGKIVGENGASIEVMPPKSPALLGFIFISRGASSNFYDTTGVTNITAGNPHIAIGVGTYNWATNLGAGDNEEGWKQQP